MNILFVCTGNTCRSPMAEALARDTFKARGEAVCVSSAGLMAVSGQQASAHAIATMKTMHLDLSAHVSQRVTAAMIEQADLIIAMGQGHLAQLRTIDPLCGEKSATLHARVGNGPQDVADPFGQSLATYKRCATELKQAIIALSQSIS